MRDARDSVEVNRVAALLFVGSTFPFAAIVDGKDYAVSAIPNSVALFSAFPEVSMKCIHHRLEAVDILVQKHSWIHLGYMKPKIFFLKKNKLTKLLGSYPSLAVHKKRMFKFRFDVNLKPKIIIDCYCTSTLQNITFDLLLS